MNATQEATLYSVVIPTCHRNDLLATCLGRFEDGRQVGMKLIGWEEQSSLPSEATSNPHTSQTYEVIVSDDGKSSTAEEMIRQHFPWAHWLPGRREGPAANRNNGAKHARGTWLVFTDDDCLADPVYLAAFSSAARSSDAGVLEGRTYADRPRMRMDEVSPVNENGGYLWSCNFAIRRELFQSIGGFDERFRYAAMEDVDLRERLRAMGKAAAFTRDASVCHPWRVQRGWESLRQKMDSIALYVRLHPEERSRYSVSRCLYRALSILRREVLPGIHTYKGAGIHLPILTLCMHLLLGVRLSLNQGNAEVPRERSEPLRDSQRGGEI